MIARTFPTIRTPMVRCTFHLPLRFDGCHYLPRDRLIVLRVANYDQDSRAPICHLSKPIDQISWHHASRIRLVINTNQSAATRNLETRCPRRTATEVCDHNALRKQSYRKEYAKYDDRISRCELLSIATHQMDG